MPNIVKSFGAMIALFLLVVSLKYLVLYGQFPTLFIAVDIITHSIFSVPIIIIFYLSLELDFVKPRMALILAPSAFFILTIFYLHHSANSLNLTQFIGDREVFRDGAITTYGIFVFYSVRLMLACAVAISLRPATK